jgi:peptidoglycan hydrolase CwlO-like protein
LKKLNEDIEELDAKNKRGKLSKQEVVDMKCKFEELWRSLNSKKEMLIQRSRSKWLSGGEANSKYLSWCMNIRFSRN